MGPYPAICYLTGFLRTIGRDAEQADASLAVLLWLIVSALAGLWILRNQRLGMLLTAWILTKGEADVPRKGSDTVERNYRTESDAAKH